MMKAMLLPGLMLYIAAAFVAPAVPVPATHEEIQARVKQLRAAYAPFLRSLPAPLSVRKRTEIVSPWRSRFEIENAKRGDIPEPPDWFREDLDDADWEKTTVPEWRYDARNPILWYRTHFEADPSKLGGSPTRRVFLVFGGVEWEAQVWLNGKPLGRHMTYYEPFRFDVTRLLKAQNTLAVRVISGKAFSQPRSNWALFPLVPADRQVYTRDKTASISGHRKGDVLVGGGYGIHREVYLETTGEAAVMEIFTHANPKTHEAAIVVETDATAARRATMDVDILPENFEGKSYRTSISCDLPRGTGQNTLSIPMPGAKAWLPDQPYLYRCRVTLRDGERVIDVQDSLFGSRSFGMVSKQHPRVGLPEGMLLLNDQPVYLRGTNIQGLNALWYWGERDKLIDVLLMLKAANFNAIRSCQHVCYPEVRELLDRLGIMSQQDQGGRYNGKPQSMMDQMVMTGRTLARVCYNNPGVVLLSFANECAHDPTAIVEAVLKADPERIVIPISGNSWSRALKGGPVGYPAMPERLWASVIDDPHSYPGWARSCGRMGAIWTLSERLAPGRLVTMGEYGGEAIDGYETMKHYPEHWGAIPPPDADALLGNIQTEKNDVRQFIGFRGRLPKNLGEYIEASQNYQTDLVAEFSKGMRLSPRRLAGYFQFHFIDVVPANWPKSIVSHDLRPKKAYYEMARVNQPVVPLFQLNDRGEVPWFSHTSEANIGSFHWPSSGRVMELWVANDLNQALPGCRLAWTVAAGGETFVRGAREVNVPALNVVKVGAADLAPVPESAHVVTISLVLSDAKGGVISRYEREVFLRAWREQEKLLEGQRVQLKKPPSH